MEASGAQAKAVPCVTADGERTTAMVYASANIVQIGDVTFERADLLLAIGVNAGDLPVTRTRLNTHETMATNARRTLHELVGPEVHGSQRPAQKVAVILEALYQFAGDLEAARQALGDSNDDRQHALLHARSQAGLLYEALTGEPPDWLALSVWADDVPR